MLAARATVRLLGRKSGSAMVSETSTRKGRISCALVSNLARAQIEAEVWLDDTLERQVASA